MEAVKYLGHNWIAIAAIIISLVSLGITFWKNIVDKNLGQDKALFEQLKQTLRLAYESLVTDNGSPSNNRQRWIDSAIHIARYRELKVSLKTKLFKTICDEQEIFWGGRFYESLQRINSSRFFESINPEEMDEEHIDPKSAALVYSMSVWPKSKQDPISSQSFEALVIEYGLFTPLHRHFQEYIERRHKKLAEQVIHQETMT